ncbi:hypothetical protein [Schumannella sp. 10F1B-5-1]|uniref:hypothetical protein n=1 Tax=Schumannella sp. 10F1B-5-1 TaxID=2590780 RepID=UPI001130953B|nr:hypothetical protein [Schumannella sp. 10F1B-5-1]TPW78388.1 hypothetical protein FJ658_00850 [Schumannella sp. 10F1B-5-1]
MRMQGGADEELRWVKKPEGAYRSRSNRTAGYETELIRDSEGRLLGPSESRAAIFDEVSEPGKRHTARPDPRQQVAEAMLDAAIAAASPYLRKAIEAGVEMGLDAIVQLVGWARRRAEEHKAVSMNEKQPSPPRTRSLKVMDVEFVDDEPGSAIEANRPLISGDEYRGRFLSALAAERYAAEEKRRLARVRVADEALSPELRVALRAALVKPAIELDEETLAVVVEFLNGSQIEGGPYLLLPATDEDPSGGGEIGRS